MASLLRVIRQTRWLDLVGVDWSERDDFPADPLGDLCTSQNSLSVYEVQKEDDIFEIAVAYAATRESVANVDYALIDDSNLSVIGLSVEKVPGETPDPLVNEIHYDLANFTARKVLVLAEVMAATATLARLQKNQVERGLVEGVKSGRLEQSRIKLNLWDEIAVKLGS